MILHPWSHTSSAGLTLRGWHSPPSGKPLLHFLHGNGFCARVYEPMLRHLAADFDLWLCDIQAHGDSDEGGRFLGWNRNALFATAALEAGRGRFGDVPLFATGHSFGGVLTSLMLAAQPELFQRAVLLDPVLFTPTMIGGMALTSLLRLPSPNKLVAKTLQRRQRWPDRTAAYAELFGRGTFKGWTDEALKAYVDHALKDAGEEVTLKCPVTHEAAIFSSYPRRLWRNLRLVTTPTLILHGEQSFPFVAESVQRWCRLNRHIDARQVAGGHCFMQENPPEAAAMIRQFLLR